MHHAAAERRHGRKWLAFFVFGLALAALLMAAAMAGRGFAFARARRPEPRLPDASRAALLPLAAETHLAPDPVEAELQALLLEEQEHRRRTVRVAEAADDQRGTLLGASLSTTNSP